MFQLLLLLTLASSNCIPGAAGFPPRLEASWTAADGFTVSDSFVGGLDSTCFNSTTLETVHEQHDGVEHYLQLRAENTLVLDKKRRPITGTWRQDIIKREK